jgi:hypothetical protein
LGVGADDDDPTVGKNYTLRRENRIVEAATAGQQCRKRRNDDADEDDGSAGPWH